ncbi:TIR domain-containing protein [Novosphingobium flavum]|uniref:TIR domain-containing protein n=1 Tax=Novosphingobium flavum TaxID=1778672 RepID=A0A7X1FRK5_9SPHN|nr:TIR domain-containing protein [Novosphingobium flavum]MBC2665675.1 TIR domain-containing protein [Novosphingobium flavum]
MAYRNGTYVAFHAGGTTDPTASDIRYYNIMKAWHENADVDFRFVNSHEKTAAVRDTSARETLMRSLRSRLGNSKNMVLILSSTTREDTDWVPYEIGQAVDACGIPIIAAYVGYDWIMAPGELSHLWPTALASRINSGTARVIHVPFQRRVLTAAIHQFNLSTPPQGALTWYTKEAYASFGVTIY